MSSSIAPQPSHFSRVTVLQQQQQQQGASGQAMVAGAVTAVGVGGGLVVCHRCAICRARSSLCAAAIPRAAPSSEAVSEAVSDPALKTRTSSSPPPPPPPSGYGASQQAWLAAGRHLGKGGRGGRGGKGGGGGRTGIGSVSGPNADQRVVVLAGVQDVNPAVGLALAVGQGGHRLAAHDRDLYLEVLGQNQDLILAAL